MVVFVKDKRLELPMHHDSKQKGNHFRPKSGFGLFFAKINGLRYAKSRIVFLFALVLVSTFLLLSKLVGGNVNLMQYIPTSLDEQEYYDYDFKGLDIDTIKKYDEGVSHYIISKGGMEALSSEDKEAFEREADMLLASTTDLYDLSQYNGASNGAANRDHVLLCVPLRDAASLLPMLFKNLMNLTYPHELIDIAFLVSDCTDNGRTMSSLLDFSKELQNGTLSKTLQDFEADKDKGNSAEQLYLKYMGKDYLKMVKNAFNPPFHDDYDKPFRSIQIFEKDFGQQIGQGFSDRHAVKVQGVRRKLMGRARNWLTANALKPYHSWVYWRDVDVELCPGTVIEDLMKHDYDVIVPNVWRPLPTFLGGAQAYDLNSWVESNEAIKLAKTLDEDDVIVEGYAEYPTWRVHLGYLRKDNGNPDDLLDLDGVGGVSILARAQLFRKGIHFPAFTFENHAETEAFGKMAKKMGFKVGGLMHYTLWHIYEPSDDDLREIAKLERESRRNQR
ncbi:Van1p [Kluyveromyces lactis]|uniref:KLLA0D01529p n=1 Tax=Kluyveromyces lactis (strain ATCC 8585 / CBS 2359 / DSM 70799 / NBRC 1267 / NRRL Y-1140 / WM37) TaxID=284590 RepID=Q6CSF2_KLULA|nr:uncharacterized protein KLLA0_D01529g [Kluyveromyces lactis]CAH00233.1 KLLA0D01529p [Kluyveromyces lactis]|eukprot:XP_453137.1 uncharacterized protein KLLA0_D01529g [Kluyveromyces lactis]